MKKLSRMKLKLKRQADKPAKTSDLSSGEVSKYELFTGESVLPEKGPLEKAVTIKRFEYSLLGRKLKKQASIAEKQY